MTELLPEKVETRDEQVALRSQVAELIRWAAETDHLDGIKENMRRDRALQQLVDDRETLAELCRGLRWLEVHAGRVLGMDVKKGDGGGPQSPETFARERRFPKDDVHKFRTMARWTIGPYRNVEVIELVDKGAPRNHVLRRIAELTPTGQGDERWNGEPDTWAIYHADFREFCHDIPDDSIDLIVTDPPYPSEHLDLFADLAQHATRILAPRGIAFILTGQLNLPAVIERLGRHLTYGWTFLLDLPGANSRIMGRHLVQTWKPILAYTVGAWPSGQWGQDRVTSPAPDQALHGWAQNAEPMRELIRRYSRPNALVLDPFCGAGSYGYAAIQEGRRFLGVDIHPDVVQTAKGRLA